MLQAGIGGFVSQAAHRGKLLVDGIGSQTSGFETHGVAHNDDAIKGQTGLGAVPCDELIDGVFVNAARGWRTEAVEHGHLALIQIRQPKHSAVVIRLASWFAHGDGSRGILLIENLALRQQLAVFKRRHSRPKLTAGDKFFWVALRRLWPSWKIVLIVVSPDTLVRWHRAGFQSYWRFISRVCKPVGRRPVTQEIRELIFKMVAEHPTWRAPRIHGELVMLGFEVSERSVSRWLRRAPRTPDSAQRWLTFLRNHREAIAAMDFFSVPTITFGVLYCFFIIGHDRRRILHFNVTRHPTSAWIVQQLREAFPYEPDTKFHILDHDAKYGTEVPAAIRSMEIAAIRTAVGCPWQNGIAERWVGSCRRELLDYVIAVNESHLKRLLSAYVNYYHQDRTHCGLERQTPGNRKRCLGQGKVVAWPRVGGLHHRYERAA